MDTAQFTFADLSSFGVPTLILAFIAIIFVKYLPQFTNMYKESKDKETELINKMQENFTLQTGKIIETAAASSKVLEQNMQAFSEIKKVLEQTTQSWNDNTAVLKSILDSTNTVATSNIQLNKIVEGQVAEVKAVKQILEQEQEDK